MKKYEIEEVILNSFGMYECKIDGEWYNICACVHCEELHLIYNSPIETDNIIKCCKYPDNWCYMMGADKIIEKWIKDNDIKIN